MARLSAAAQFFMDDPEPPGTMMDEDSGSQGFDGPGTKSGIVSSDSSEKIVELLNYATLEPDSGKKLDALRTVQELLLHKDPNLLDNFLDEVIGFQKDRSQDVRKFLIGFIEEACKKDPEILPKVITNLQIFMADDGLAIRKRVIQAMTHLYKVALGWLCKAKTVTDNMEAVWTAVLSIKDEILNLLETDNDGMRTHAIKFMEMLVITQTHSEGENASKDLCLDDVPLTLKIARPRKLEEEAMQVFDELLKYHGSAHISSANLMICMGALTNIAKQRPNIFMAKVIIALEMLHANLPPTLARSQVSSVRKNLKTQLLSLLKIPAAAENYFSNITTLLTDLGASREEVMRVIPNFEIIKRRARKERIKPDNGSAGPQSIKKPDDGPETKRIKIEEEEEDDDDEDNEEGEDLKKKNESAVDITEKFILERLNASLAADLVLLSIGRLPSDIPPQFHNTYTPIAAAGTDGQVRHVARLLAAQMTAVKIGPGVEESKLKMERTTSKIEDDDEDETGGGSREEGKISTLIGGTASGTSEPSKSKKSGTKSTTVTLMPAGLSGKKSIKKTLKLTEITKRLSPEESSRQMTKAVERILKAERVALLGGVSEVRVKIITTLAARFPTSLKSSVLNFLFEDLNKRIELAFSWLYEEYCFCHSFHKAQWNRRTDDSEYNSIFCQLIHGVIEKTDGKDRQNLLRRLYLESPMITDDAIALLKQFVQIDGSAVTVVNLMKDLVQRRPTKKLNFLNFLLEFCSHQNPEVRETAIQTVLRLHADGDFRDIIEDYSVMYLQFLKSLTPPPMLFGEDRGRSIVYNVWTDDIVRACLYLFLSLLPQNLRLFKHMSDVFKTAKSSVVDYKNQRNTTISHSILRELDVPVSKISMENTELLDIVENCPEECETLVSRIIHILTDKARPTQQLVDKVREIYHERSMDIRFLIPVLNGLTKQEVTTAIPKLIKLSQAVVKEVFTRLWSKGPLSPADLLIALHNIDVTASNEDMRAVLQATKLCFQEKKVYTQEVLSIVLQQLMELPNIPVLFMRTVIQSHTTYPRIMGFVMNILQRLIVKQVWKQKLVWDGFIKCCERTVPQSYAVMLQLPPNKLAEFLTAVPKLRDTLFEHVQAFNESQRAHISAGTMKVLYNVKEEVVAVDNIKQEPGTEVVIGEPEPPGV